MPGTKLIVILLLVGAVCAAPAPKENVDDDKIALSKKFYDKDFVCYEGEHEIVNILLPINSLNVYGDDDDIETFDDNKFRVFFVEADMDAHGHREDKGLYVLKDGVATKLLEHGRDAAANMDEENADVFFAAQDGIYIYDQVENKAVKYGSVVDDIIAITKENATDVIYYLNKDHELYKVSEAGHEAVKIDDVVGAQEIVLDYKNNLYYYTEDKEVYVKTGSGVKKVEGLPENPKDAKLIRPPFIMEDSVIFLSDNEYYIINWNGTSESSDFSIELAAKPSAYAMDATVIQYYAYHKKIYRFNILKILTSDVLKDLSKFFEENETTLQNAAPKKFSKKQKH